MLSFAGLLGCGPAADGTGRLQARLIRLPRDTVRFTTGAHAERCTAAPGTPRGVILRGAGGGNGVLVWLRSPDSLATGDWPVLQRLDSTTGTGALVGARYMIGDVAHGVPLDSGAVAVSRRGGRVTARVRGSGLDVASASRVALDASFDAVPLTPDTVPCRQTP